jgi:hypothetical protein
MGRLGVNVVTAWEAGARPGWSGNADYSTDQVWTGSFECIRSM